MCFFYVLISSVKWGHLENLDPNSTNTIFSTNPIGSSSHFESGSIFQNYCNLNCELVP